MIPLGMFSAARPRGGGGDTLWSDAFETTGPLTGYSQLWTESKTAGGSVNTAGIVTFDWSAGTSLAVRESVSASDVDITIQADASTQIRRRWSLSARVRAGYACGDDIGNATHGYAFGIANDDALSSVRLAIYRDNVRVAGSSSLSLTTEPWTMRMRVVGDVVQGKAWPSADAEPSGWHLEYTDPEPLPAGAAGFGVYNSANRATRFIGPLVIAGA